MEKMKKEYTEEQDVIKLIIGSVFIRGVDLDAHKREFSDDRCGLISKLNNLYKDYFNKWINVKDRLPNIGDDVLIFREDSYSIYTDYLVADVHGIHWNDNPNEVVTHWMELPDYPTNF